MFRLAHGSAGRLLPGLFRIFIIIAVAAYGAAIVQNVTEVLRGVAHQHAPTQVAQRPTR